MALSQVAAVSVGVVALLLGLFVIPLALLWLGHGLRYRSPREKGVFWGGTFGYGAALGAFLVVAMIPPIGWEGSPLRAASIQWMLLVLPLVGAAAGAILRSR